MSSLSGEAAARGAVVSRSCRVADVSYRAFLAARDAPRIHWADPDGLELSGVGDAATVTASGADRFEAVREWATALFDDTDHDGPEVARPRLLGGFAFRDDHAPEDFGLSPLGETDEEAQKPLWGGEDLDCIPDPEGWSA